MTRITTEGDWGNLDAQPFPAMPGLGEVHVWLISLLGEVNLGLLSIPERERLEAMKSARAREQFAHCRAALRILLSRYLEREPSSLEITCIPGEKPRLLGEDALAFSYSHTEGLGAVAFARDAALGLDIERPDSARDYAGIAQRFFDAEEQAEFFAAPQDQQNETFLRLWTRKEAVFKAAGVGLRGLTTPVAENDYHVHSLSVDDTQLALASTQVLHPTLYRYYPALQPAAENG